MISTRLKIIFLVSIPFFIAHGLEEYFTGFYDSDMFSRFVFGVFESMPVLQATFLLFQLMIWLLFVISSLLIYGGRWPLRLMIVLGLVFIFELHHLAKAIFFVGYYPGIATASALYVIGFFFWTELIKSFREAVLLK